MTLPSDRAQRRGYSLIELLVVMTMLIVLMTVCAGLVEMLLRLDGAARDHVNATMTIGRLGRAFRAGVRAAEGTQLTEEGELITLELPAGRVVEYRVVKNKVVRRERNGDQTVRREGFELPPRTPIQFQVEEQEGGRFLRVTFDRKHVLAGNAGRRPFSIVAALGAGRRLSGDDGP